MPQCENSLAGAQAPRIERQRHDGLVDIFGQSLVQANFFFTIMPASFRSAEVNVIKANWLL